MAAGTMAKLVIAPEVQFARIEQILSDQGWGRAKDTAKRPPLVKGELEFASWSQADKELRAHYSCNPVVGLRVLEIDGVESSAATSRIAETVPHLSMDDLKSLLQDPDPRRILLGLYAAVELEAFLLLNEINALAQHSNQRVSSTAVDTRESLSLRLLQRGQQQLEAERAKHPDRSVIFPRIADVELRRNLLRWMIREPSAKSQDVQLLLGAALHDEDWLVRLLGAIAAVRYGATELWLEIRKMELPRTSRSGLDQHQQSMLLALRAAILGELAQEAPVSGSSERTRLERHLRQIVIGRDDGVHDDVYLQVERWLTPTDSHQTNGRWLF